jgi:hypothetical protein
MLLKTTRETVGNFSSASGAVRRAGRASMASSSNMLSTIGKELKAHAPFTEVGDELDKTTEPSASPEETED